jgi:hypothetical protein
MREWGLGAVASWTSLQTTAFKSKWEQAKKAIETFVSDPEKRPVEHGGDDENVVEVEDTQTQYQVTLEKGLFDWKGNFKFPLAASFVAIICFLTEKAIERDIITKLDGDSIKNVLESLK